MAAMRAAMRSALEGPPSSLTVEEMGRLKALVARVKEHVAGGVAAADVDWDVALQDVTRLAAAVDSDPTVAETAPRVTSVNTVMCKLLLSVLSSLQDDAPSGADAVAVAALRVMGRLCSTGRSATIDAALDERLLALLASAMARIDSESQQHVVRVAAASCAFLEVLARHGGLDSILEAPALLDGLCAVLKCTGGNMARLLAPMAERGHPWSSMINAALRLVKVCAGDDPRRQDLMVEAGVSSACVALLGQALVRPTGGADDDESAVLPSFLSWLPVEELLPACIALVSGGHKETQALFFDDGAGGCVADLVNAVGVLWLCHAACMAVDDVPGRLSAARVDIQSTFLGVQLLVTLLQVGSPEHRDTVARLVAKREQPGWIEATMVSLDLDLSLPLAAHVPPDQAFCLSTSEQVRGAIWELRHNHFDDDACVDALTSLAELLAEPAVAVVAQHELLHAAHGMKCLVRSLNNIEEDVMLAAIKVAYALLLDSPAAQDSFLTHGGLVALSGCMQDYNVLIRQKALEVVALLASEQSRCRAEVRTSGLLAASVQVVSSYPADDITPPVVHAASSVLCHAVTGNRTNQLCVLHCGGAEALVRLLIKAVEALPVTAPAACPSSPPTSSAPLMPASTADAAGEATIGDVVGDAKSDVGPESSSVASSAAAAGAGGAGAGSVVSTGASSAVASSVHQPPPTVTTLQVAEVAALTLTNLLYQCPQAQTQAGRNGTLRLIATLVWNWVTGGRHDGARARRTSELLHASDAAALLLPSPAAPDSAEGAGAGEGKSGEGPSGPPSSPGRRRALVDVDASASKLADDVAVMEADGSMAEMQLPDGAGDTAATMLMVVVNACDGHRGIQACLDCDAVERLLLRCLRGEHAGLAAAGAMVLSHMVMGNAASQRRYTTADVVSMLLHGVSGGSAAPAGSLDVRAAEVEPDAGDKRKPSAEASEEVATERDGLHYVDGALDGHAGEGTVPAAVAAAGASQLCLYSLIALNNLIYNNAAAQEAVGAADGLACIMPCLQHDSRGIRKTAAFCIGNLVKERRANAEAVAAGGGVQLLMSLLNDEEDDELSKKAFAALSHMKDVAVHAVLESLDECCARLPHRLPPGVPSAVQTVILEACRSPPRPGGKGRAGAGSGAGSGSGPGAGSGSSTGDAGEEAARQWLERCLPVLNGLVYTSQAAREWLVRSVEWRSGLAPLLRVFLLDVPANICVFAAFVMSNITIAHDDAVKAKAAELRATEVLVPFIAQLQPHEGEEDSSELREARGVLYSLIAQLCVHYPASLCKLAQDTELLTVLLPPDVSGTGVVAEAMELALTIGECPDVVRQMRRRLQDGDSPGPLHKVIVQCAGCKGAVAADVDARQLAVLVARAEQCLAEVTQLPGRGVALPGHHHK